jgi:NAD(P)-dependent dehydrogenase (short-subunit alcohol dehydrogenase family)
MGPAPFITPVVDSTSVFLPNIFKGKVVFVTGGGSGICRDMTQAVVRLLAANYVFLRTEMRGKSRCVMEQMQPLLVASQY